MSTDHLLPERTTDDVAGAASSSSTSDSEPDDAAVRLFSRSQPPREGIQAKKSYEFFEDHPGIRRVTQPMIKLDDTWGLYELYSTGPPGPISIEYVHYNCTHTLHIIAQFI